MRYLLKVGLATLAAYLGATDAPIACGQNSPMQAASTDQPEYVRPEAVVGEESAQVVRVVPISDALREEFLLNEFYAKVAIVDDIPIIGSERVSDYALLECAWVVDHMLADCDRIKEALLSNKVRIGIIAATEYTTDIPENQTPRMLARAAFHDRRSRGLGGVEFATCGEENLLSLHGDPYGAENITIHEFAHTIASNLQRADPKWWQRLEELYRQAQNEGLWADTYAATNEQEYWAEATQSWFDCNNRHADGRIHNGIWNREKLKGYDPRMAEFLAETFGDRPWRYSKTVARPKEQLGHLAGLDRDRMPTFSFENSPRIQAESRETRQRRHRESSLDEQAQKTQDN